MEPLLTVICGFQIRQKDIFQAVDFPGHGRFDGPGQKHLDFFAQHFLNSLLDHRFKAFQRGRLGLIVKHLEQVVGVGMVFDAVLFDFDGDRIGRPMNVLDMARIGSEPLPTVRSRKVPLSPLLRPVPGV